MLSPGTFKNCKEPNENPEKKNLEVPKTRMFINSVQRIKIIICLHAQSA